ncbi:MAG: hypothetical protein J7647_05710 [Cyanobacteria bacterium SBLK]|nr:hypothetical protein [Cyanobacteria bacterium SBLK]
MKRFLSVLSILCAFVMSVQFFLMSPAAMAGEVPAVITPPGACFLDINQCGNSSSCTCPDEYEYSPIVGYCLIEDIDDATERGNAVKSICSMQAAFIPTTCTDDLNSVGYPSKCLCPGSTHYDQRFGQCVASFR